MLLSANGVERYYNDAMIMPETKRQIERNGLFFSGFVLSSVLQVPEATVVFLGVGGVSIIYSLSSVLDYLDYRSERSAVVAAAEQITAEAARTE